jgi:predicted ester cyclase
VADLAICLTQYFDQSPRYAHGLSSRRSLAIRHNRVNRENLRLEGITVTRDEAQNLAGHWIAAWNAHDLDLILSHYDEAVELTSPVAAQLLGTPDGKVVGKANLRAYFQRGLQAYPDLQFSLVDVLCGINSVVLYYTNQKGRRTAEFMELSPNGKVARVVANYGP